MNGSPLSHLYELCDPTKDPFEKNNIADDPANAERLEPPQREPGGWREERGGEVPLYRDGKYKAPNVRQGG
ncbi:MAG: hypothetical protein RRC34_11080 [Lentisphaeria bacterium]|nr:hypothetical protein [Lentisphaeria bacterium]